MVWITATIVSGGGGGLRYTNSPNTSIIITVLQLIFVLCGPKHGHGGLLAKFVDKPGYHG